MIKANKLRGKLLSTCIFIISHLLEHDYKLVDEDYDNGEHRIVYQHPDDDRITVTFMIQE